MALADMDDDDGVPVNVVSKKLHVDSSFVTTQSKLLEKKGFVRRRPSTEDARIVQMSLTDKTYKHLASLSAQQEALNEFIYVEFRQSRIGGDHQQAHLPADQARKGLRESNPGSPMQMTAGALSDPGLAGRK